MDIPDDWRAPDVIRDDIAQEQWYRVMAALGIDEPRAYDASPLHPWRIYLRQVAHSWLHWLHSVDLEERPPHYQVWREGVWVHDVHLDSLKN